MRTGRYRVRRTWDGRAVLQEEYDGPMFIGGHVDSSIRVLRWTDVRFDQLDNIQFAKLSCEYSQGDKSD
jgi:hypothetical protein